MGTADLNEKQRLIVQAIAEMSGKYSTHQIFSDWVEMCALMVQNACTLSGTVLWNKREEQFNNIVKKYDPKERLKMCEMFAWLTEAYEIELTDILGEIYMSSEMGSKLAGQFFTPFHVSEATAKLTDKDEYGLIRVYEPSCGSGGMIIGKAKALRDQGKPYQQMMQVTAGDIDSRAVHMCYLQLSLLGIKAIVMRVDGLSGGKPDKADIFHTPRSMGAI